MESIHNIDLGIIIGYLITVTAVGLWFVRRGETSTDYYLGGRSIRWPYVGASLFASNISAEAYVAFAGGAYAHGIVVGATGFIAPLNLAMLALLFLPYYLKHRVYTIPEFLEKRFNPASRIIMSVILLLLNIFTRLTVGLWAGALIVKTLGGWDTTTTIWVIGILTAVYTLFGGLKAVVYTETLQTVIMYAGAAILAFLSLKTVGGWSVMVEKLPEQHMTWARSIHDTDLPWTTFTLPMFLGGLFYWCMDQTIVQRALAAKSLDHARKGSIFGGFLILLHIFFIVVPGLCALILIPNLQKADEAYPMMIVKILPIGLRGLILSAVLAAIMSTLASTFNSTATLIVHDFAIKFWPDISQKRQIHLGWITICLMTLAGILWTPFMEKFGSLWMYLMRVSFYLQLPVVAIFMLGMMWKRTTGLAALTGLTIGFGVGVICLIDDVGLFSMSLINHWLLKPFAHRGFLVFVMGLTTTVVLSFLSPKPQENRTLDELTVNWKNPQLFVADPSPLWQDWRFWFVGLIIVDLFLYFKFM